MPIKWTPELDSILLHAVFEESSISFSKALCNKISERVKGTGIDCTPKAVENRLYSWKKKNVSASPATTAPTKDASATPTPSKGAKAKKAGGARGGKKGNAKQITPESEGEESPSMRGRKRARTEEDDEEEVKKKIKVEDIGDEEEDEGREV